MLNKQQIKLVQTAVRAAGLRTKQGDGQYRLLLSRYRQSNRTRVTSCKQLNNWQLEDLLAICEAMGWQCPGKKSNHFRAKAAEHGTVASFAQRAAIKKLRDDLGWDNRQLGGFIKRVTEGRRDNLTELTPSGAYKVIEGLKAMFGRKHGRAFSSLKEIQEHTEAATDGQKNT